MLILSRKTEQAVVIQGNIVVTVLGVDGDRVKLGISAPPDVIVLREELVSELAEENRTAAAGAHARLTELRGLLRTPADGAAPGPIADGDTPRSS